MEDALIELLSAFGYDVLRQGSMPDSREYPTTFITFWGNEESDAFYDNDENLVLHTYSVNVYSSNPETAYTLLESIRNSLKTNGWIITSRGFDVASDEPTHIGRGLRATYMEQVIQT